jgi:FtsH-binding integral membrane protein
MTGITYRSAAEINSAMLNVYNNMFLAVVNSMIVSALVASSSALMQFLFTGAMKWIVIFSPLAAILFLTYRMKNMTRSQAQVALHGFAALMGVSFATIFVVFNIGSIVGAFMAAAVLFATMSLWGYFTKQSLDSLGRWMFVGLIAIVIASVINIFIGSSVAQMTISAIAIIVFLGLTAYDTQKIRELVSVDHNGNTEVMGALTLYLDFINLFLNLLQLLGGRKE